MLLTGHDKAITVKKRSRIGYASILREDVPPKASPSEANVDFRNEAAPSDSAERYVLPGAPSAVECVSSRYVVAA
jgi:hypothetical protein